MHNPFTNKKNNYYKDNRIIFLRKHLNDESYMNKKSHLKIEKL